MLDFTAALKSANSVATELGLVQTVDFITPVVDDPFIFGQIAAANALSDLFAMNAKPISALNIAGFDSVHFDGEILAEILAGAADKVREAGAVILGGHTIKSSENMFGLAATGVCDKESFWSNNTAREGDVLILTKPLGIGILTTALKNKKLNSEHLRPLIELMRQLNSVLGALKGFKISAATDVTGFGFLGHLSEMLNDKIGFEVYEKNVPKISVATELAKNGIAPGGSVRNKDFVTPLCDKVPDIILCDAQTSGGLILAVAKSDAEPVLSALKSAGFEHSAVVACAIKRLNGAPILLR